MDVLEFLVFCRIRGAFKSVHTSVRLSVRPSVRPSVAVHTVVGGNILEFWTPQNKKNEVWLKRRRMSLRSFLVLFHQN